MDKTTNKFTDKDWVRELFVVGQDQLDGLSLDERNWSSSDYKFNDTGMGGSIVINPLPQPSPWTDPITNPVLIKYNKDGMGQYFSETFDDNYRVVTFRFGTMAFTSFLGFLFNMYHPGAAALVNKGRVHEIIFQIGRIIGFGASLVAWPLHAMALLGQAVMFMTRKPTSRYAYLKPGMTQYWGAAQTLLNHFMVNLGLAANTKDWRDYSADNAGAEAYFKLDGSEREAAAKAFPDLYGQNSIQRHILDSPGSFLDIIAVANRGQRLAIVRRKIIADYIGEKEGRLLNMLEDMYKGSKSEAGHSLAKLYSLWKNTSIYNPDSSAGGVLGSGIGIGLGNQAQEQTPTTDENGNVVTPPAPPPQPEGELTPPSAVSNDSADAPAYSEFDNNPGLIEYFKTEMEEGSAFISFRVDDTGPVSESFSNSYRASELAEKINSTSASARSTYFNLAGGNLGDNAVMNIMESIVGGLKSLAEGVVTGIGLEGLLIAGGGGMVTMPKYWESSEVTLPKASYSFTLTSRYANRRSALQDIYMPLACILAGAMSQAVGKHAYSAPFYCEFYDRGRMQSRFAAIDSLTITRGDGTVGFTPEGLLMSCTVSFTLAAMEEHVSMPLSEKFSFTESLISLLGATLIKSDPAKLALGSLGTQLARGLFDDDNQLMDWLAVLTGVSLNEQYYIGAKLRRRIQQRKLDVAAAFSTPSMASFLSETTVGSTLSALVFPYRAAR
jgi:hypothetical protein|nr:MAG TPA: hypothetical protein [Caudoviricetes sp.]